MNDLTEMLEHASEPDDFWSVAPEALLRAGKSRVRRRRIAAVGGAVAVALVATAAVAVGTQRPADRDQIADHRGGDHPVAREVPRWDEGLKGKYAVLSPVCKNRKYGSNGALLTETCGARGRLSGRPDHHTITITTHGVVVARMVTHDGRFGYRYHGPIFLGFPGGLRARDVDSDGHLVWEGRIPDPH